jgi:hypothetical protein
MDKVIDMRACAAAAASRELDERRWWTGWLQPEARQFQHGPFLETEDQSQSKPSNCNTLQSSGKFITCSCHLDYFY